MMMMKRVMRVAIVVGIVIVVVVIVVIVVVRVVAQAIVEFASTQHSVAIPVQVVEGALRIVLSPIAASVLQSHQSKVYIRKSIFAINSIIFSTLRSLISSNYLRS